MTVIFETCSQVAGIGRLTLQSRRRSLIYRAFSYASTEKKGLHDLAPQSLDLYIPNPAAPRYRPNGETGRRMGLKIPRSKGRAGSIPASGTIDIKGLHDELHAGPYLLCSAISGSVSSSFDSCIDISVNLDILRSWNYSKYSKPSPTLHALRSSKA